jgi:hypothetical protein
MSDFNHFDMNEACDFFDYENQEQWDKIRPYIVHDEADTEEIMEDGFVDVTREEVDAFSAGIEHAFKKLNAALDTAGVPIEIQWTDLGNNGGFVLVRTDDTPETFVHRVMKKPIKRVDSWV